MMTDTLYAVHTLESAPTMAGDALRALQATVGLIPNLAATMAESPALLTDSLHFVSCTPRPAFHPVRCKCFRSRLPTKTTAPSVLPSTASRR